LADPGPQISPQLYPRETGRQLTLLTTSGGQSCRQFLEEAIHGKKDHQRKMSTSRKRAAKRVADHRAAVSDKRYV
jgi:hypothetical protein